MVPQWSPFHLLFSIPYLHPSPFLLLLLLLQPGFSLHEKGSFHSVRFSAVLIRCNTVPRGPAPLLPTGYSRVSCPRHPVPSRARSIGYVKTLELIGPLPLHSRRNLRKVNRIGVHTLISIRREGDDCCSSRRITNRSHWRSGICCSRPLSS